MALTAPIAAAVAHRAGSAARSVGRTALIYGAIGLVGLVGLGFLVAALFIWLETILGMLGATLALGAGFLGVALIALAVVIVQGREREKELKRTAADTALIASTVSLASAGLRIVSRAKGPLLWPAIAAIAAGWYLSGRGGDSD